MGRLTEALEKSLKETKIFYLLYGSEPYIIDENYRKLISALTDDGQDVLRFEGKAFDIGDLILDTQTPSFFSSRRVIVIKNSGLFNSGLKERTEAFAEAADDIPDSASVIFIEESVDKRNRLYKKISQSGFVLDCRPPDERVLISWITDSFMRRGKKIGGKEAALFLRNTGPGMTGMKQECIKLCDYLGDKKTVSSLDMETVCTKTPDAKIFDMTNSLGDKNSAKALEIYNDLISMKESPLMVLAMIGRQLKLVSQCRYLSDMGIHREEIAERLGIREFQARILTAQAKRFNSLESIISAFKDCSKTDVMIKTGKIDAKIGVELLIVKLGDKM